MTGRVSQINTSNGGLPKYPVTGAVLLGREGVEGDRHRNSRIHGGPAKAVLMISAEYIAALVALGFPVFPGALGENLTLTGLDPHAWRAGQRYRIGDDVVIELTTLRSPCANLDVFGKPIKSELYDAACQAGDVSSPRWGHGGFYARVIRPGLLFAGAPVTLESDVA